MFKKNSRGDILTSDGHDVTQYVVEEETLITPGEPVILKLVFLGAEEGVFRQFGDATGIQVYGLSRPRMVKIRNSLDVRTIEDINLISYCEDVHLEHMVDNRAEHPMYKVVAYATLGIADSPVVHPDSDVWRDLEGFQGVNFAQNHSDMVDAIVGSMGIPASMMTPQPEQVVENLPPKSEEEEYRNFRAFVDDIPAERMTGDEWDVSC